MKLLKELSAVLLILGMTMTVEAGSFNLCDNKYIENSLKNEYKYNYPPYSVIKGSAKTISARLIDHPKGVRIAAIANAPLNSSSLCSIKMTGPRPEGYRSGPSITWIYYFTAWLRDGSYFTSSFQRSHELQR